MLLLLVGSTSLAGCAGARSAASGGYYLDDGPGRDDAQKLAKLLAQPDPVPVYEKLRDRANRPYQVMGQNFTPMTKRTPYRKEGVASWYGKRFHGRPTSIGEIYDMYQMTAAHPTLPLPSYARVRNLENGREVIVRVNDRGPFLRGRLIDLSYLAAHKLGYIHKGHARVEVELINPVAGAGTVAASQNATSAVPEARDADARTVVSKAAVSPDVQVGAVRFEGAVLPKEAGRAEGLQFEDASGSAHAGSVTPDTLERARRYVANANVNSNPGDDGHHRAPGTDHASGMAAAGTGASATASPDREAEPITATDGAVSAAPGTSHRKVAAAVVQDGDLDGGWYLQLGVFSQLENALRVQRRQQAESSRSDPPVEILEKGKGYQVVFGPFDDEATARAAAGRIGQWTGQRPWVSYR
ncbi:MAG: septal ring lytic transglycosylase RlpA family protein [Lautropia sp.]|nr:septal ring lytic transglycosylase RlpA family protein [Lautropia sp.]